MDPRLAACVLSLACSFVSVPAGAQSVSVALERGDGTAYFPHGLVARVGQGAVDDSGQWFDMAQYRVHAGLSGLVPYLVTEDEVLFSRGQSLSRPAGTVIVNPSALFAVSPNGNLLHSWSISPSASPTTALLWNDRAIAIQGELATASGLPAGSVYQEFLGARINGKNEVLASVRLSTGPALLFLRLDAAGTVLSSQALLFQDPAPVSRAASIALNERGDWMAAVSESARPGGSILINGTPVARAGDPAPLAGHVYTDFGDSSVDLDDQGRFLFSAAVDGGPGASVLVRDGRLFAKTGDVLPALAPAEIHSLLYYPVSLSNSGDVYWRADVSDALGLDALMRNREVVVRRETTLVEGRDVSDVWASSLSPSGRFWLGNVTMEPRVGSVYEDALLFADFGLAEPIHGCQPAPSTLRLADGLVLAGHTITLEMDGTPAIGSLSYVYFALGSALDAAGCGIRTPFGEILLDSRSPRFFRSGPAYGGAPVSISLAIPSDAALVDLEFFAQGLFLDPTSVPLAQGVKLSNGLRLEIGAP